MTAVQSWQPSLFGSAAADPGFDPAFATAARTELDRACWVDVVPGSVHDGADTLFAQLLERAPWEGHSVHMYDQRLTEPRLRATGEWPAPGRPPVLDAMARALSARYGIEFCSVGLNLYRDGRDSVAWHGDRIARERPAAIVAVLTLGAARPFLLRPAGGGASTRLVPHAGDLVVMGGACQRLWQHTIPKVRAAGPRISVTFRHAYD